MPTSRSRRAAATTPSSPASSPSGALVYIHGGGFTYGTLDEFEVPMRLIAERAGIVTYIVEYQLAPEAKYPVQIDEIEYVVRWLSGNAAQGIDPAKIGAGSDSAGSNMTCVIALRDGRNLVSNTDDVAHPHLTPLNAGSHAGLPPAILVTSGFDPLRDVGHAYSRAGNDLTYIHNPGLTHGFPQFTRSSTACHQATLELADLIKTKIG